MHSPQVSITNGLAGIHAMHQTRAAIRRAEREEAAALNAETLARADALHGRIDRARRVADMLAYLRATDHLVD